FSHICDFVWLLDWLRKRPWTDAGFSPLAFRFRQHAVDAGRATTLEDHDRHECEAQEKVLESLPFLRAVPVHEKTMRRVHHGDGREKDRSHARRGQAAPQARDEQEGAERFRGDGGEGEYP